MCSKQGVIIGKLQWSQGIWSENWQGKRPQFAANVPYSMEHSGPGSLTVTKSTADNTTCIETKTVPKKKERLPSAEDIPTLPQLIDFNLRLALVVLTYWKKLVHITVYWGHCYCRMIKEL